MEPVDAIQTKRRFPHLDSLVSDEALRRAARPIRPDAWDLCDAFANPLPLAAAMLAALDDNLRALSAVGAIRARNALRDRLLNGEQLLNTLSELALARHLLQTGWQVALDYKFFATRDVDIWCKLHDIERLVEVVNMAIPAAQRAEPLEDTPGSCARSTSFPDENDPLVDKVVAKFNDKFGPALSQGWTGEIWVAVDYTKNHEQDVRQFVRDLFFPDWPEAVVQFAARRCPQLKGVCFYSHLPQSIVPRAVHWNGVE
jgi:hypothetical protein